MLIRTDLLDIMELQKKETAPIWNSDTPEKSWKEPNFDSKKTNFSDRMSRKEPILKE